MAETNSAGAEVGKPDPIRATLLNGESVSASVEVGCETHEVAINISTRAAAYHLLLTGEGAIDLALRIIAVVGRLRKLDQPID
jgi:hypothetical protein